MGNNKNNDFINFIIDNFFLLISDKLFSEIYLHISITSLYY